MKKMLMVMLMVLGLVSSASAANFNYAHCSTGVINEIKFQVTGDYPEIVTYNHVFLEVRNKDNNIVYVYDSRIYPFSPVLHIKSNVVSAVLHIEYTPFKVILIEVESAIN